ncbi:MAG: T9SS type A sorting domain-containing protein, partial [Ignavibacteria bacterium]|nr:T9SS type A sorting domain-containing protein [Ignavibacteria bacterium]
VDIAIDNNTNLYVTGNIYSTSDIGTVKYNSSGILQWAISYSGAGNNIDRAVSVGVDADAKVYVSGNSFDALSGNDIAVVKYASSSIGINNISGEVPDGFSLSQNYPNPFNPVTKIRFEIAAGITGSQSNVSLVIFDLSGKEIEELYNGSLSPGKYEADWNASGYSSGVYFYKLSTADGFSETKKMLLTK